MLSRGGHKVVCDGLHRSPSFHGVKDVLLATHLHHSTVETAHGRHDPVRADGHEGQEFEKS